MAYDANAFVRWEAAQLLAQREILANVQRRAQGQTMQLGAELERAFTALMQDQQADPALVAEALTLPAEDYLAEQMPVVDVDGIHEARNFVRQALAASLQQVLLERYHQLGGQPYDKSAASMAGRSLRNTCLTYLMATSGGASLAAEQFKTSDNMTDTLAALRGLVHFRASGAAEALAAFESQWSGDALVMDKWFAIQASVPGPGTVGRVAELVRHPAFSIRNPNKVRSVIGVFALMNPTAFHASDGSGYRLHADKVIELDALNPQVAARMAGAYNAWTRYDDRRRELMKSQLSRIAATTGLSGDVSEIIHNALGME
jgi:aminopeptidase N